MTARVVTCVEVVLACRRCRQTGVLRLLPIRGESDDLFGINAVFMITCYRVKHRCKAVPDRNLEDPISLHAQRFASWLTPAPLFSALLSLV